MDRLLCALRGHHEPKRQAIGGFRCVRCGTAGADLDDMGFRGDGYVPPLRRVFSREKRAVTRTAAWDPTDRRGW